MTRGASDQVDIKLERGDDVSTLEINIEMPGSAASRPARPPESLQQEGRRGSPAPGPPDWGSVRGERAAATERDLVGAELATRSREVDLHNLIDHNSDPTSPEAAVRILRALCRAMPTAQHIAVRSARAPMDLRRSRTL